MLTSFFSKSKPVNYLIVGILMTIFFWIHHVFTAKTVFTLTEIAFQLGMLLLFIISMLLVDFVARKNDLTKNNTFKIFLYAIFTLLLPITFLETEILIANFFILLGLRRILSLKSHKDTQKKIFDAALWISVASCFYFWSFLFVVLLFIAILFIAGNNFKNYLIPFVGMATVIVLTNSYTLLVQDAFYTPLDWVGTFGFDFTTYNTINLWIPISIVIAILVWVIAHHFIDLAKKSKKFKMTANLILVALSIAVLITLVTPTKNGAELLFMAMPFSVLTANYFEMPNEKVFKEILLWLLALTPFFIFLM
ncbi:MAG: hypothetical protein H0X63_00210 [Flavobacteriales bacterium]|jgi:hypothetical protein|nr:hypothetical protein [Flavobacteriales bacterium]